jgi:hypothetical protein
VRFGGSDWYRAEVTHVSPPLAGPTAFRVVTREGQGVWCTLGGLGIDWRRPSSSSSPAAGPELVPGQWYRWTGTNDGPIAPFVWLGRDDRGLAVVAYADSRRVEVFPLSDAELVGAAAPEPDGHWEARRRPQVGETVEVCIDDEWHRGEVTEVTPHGFEVDGCLGRAWDSDVWRWPGSLREPIEACCYACDCDVTVENQGSRIDLCERCSDKVYHSRVGELSAERKPSTAVSIIARVLAGATAAELAGPEGYAQLAWRAVDDLRDSFCAAAAEELARLTGQWRVALGGWRSEGTAHVDREIVLDNLGQLHAQQLNDLVSHLGMRWTRPAEVPAPVSRAGLLTAAVGVLAWHCHTAPCSARVAAAGELVDIFVRELGQGVRS